MGKNGDLRSYHERIAEAMAILDAVDKGDDIDPEAPSSLYKCYDDNGDLDHLLYFKYTQRMARRQEAEDRALDMLTMINFELLYGSDDEDDPRDQVRPPPLPPPPRTKKRLICRPNKSPSTSAPKNKNKVARVLFPS